MSSLLIIVMFFQLVLIFKIYFCTVLPFIIAINMQCSYVFPFLFSIEETIHFTEEFYHYEGVGRERSFSLFYGYCIMQLTRRHKI